jgi:hypothetical protein
MKTARDMLEARPAHISNRLEMLAACIRECFECAQACTLCADACLGEQDVHRLLICIRMNLNCADICEATGRVLARSTALEWGVLFNQLQACLAACQHCALECERHAHHEHCVVCFQACRRCEKACLDLFSTLPHA